MRDELLSQAARAVEIGRETGAEEVVAVIGWGRSLEFQWREGKLEKVQEDIGKSLGVELYVDGRYSAHSTNDLDPTRLKEFLAEAVALTRCLEPDPFRKIPDASLYADRADAELDLVDASLVNLTREDRVAWCRTLDDRARAHDEVVSATAGVMDGHTISARVSSNGFRGAHERTGLYYGAEVTARDGETKRPEAARYVGACHRADIPTPDVVGKEALERVLLRRGARKAGSVRTTMVVSRECAGSILGRVFGALSAGAIQQKRSFLAELLGEEIASPIRTMTDDPLLKRGSSSRLYDGEGISTRQRPILAKGRLETFFIDTYYGRKLGFDPTTGSRSNVLFAHGDKGLDEIVKDVGEGIYVTSIIGGNANMTSGDYSFGIQGHVIRAGEVAEPVAEMNITGNYMTLLKQLVMVGNDPEPWASFRAPTLVFEDTQFSGA